MDDREVIRALENLNRPRVEDLLNEYRKLYSLSQYYTEMIERSLEGVEKDLAYLQELRP